MVDKRNSKIKALRLQRAQGASRGPLRAVVTECADCPHRDKEAPSFRFGFQASNRVSFDQLTSSQQRNVLATFAKMEAKSWQDILETGGKSGSATGLGYGPVHERALRRLLPESFPEGKRLTHFRASGGERVFGFRDSSVFNVTWFDPNHEETR